MPADRRAFLAAASASLAAAPAFGGSRQEKYRVALIGSGWWGTNILREALASGRCECVALCDPDARQFTRADDSTGNESGPLDLAKEHGDDPKLFADYRECLEQISPDIAIVATPDHWHPLACIAACEAGAHVYVEKPVSHTILEGRAMVEAARKHNRAVQVGTHRRVSPHNVSGMKFLKDGGAGEVGMVRCFVHYPGGSGSPSPVEEPPAELNWDLWCGPAPLSDYRPALHPKGFRQFLDYANGTLGDWGIHWLDQVNWFLNDAETPSTVHSLADIRVRTDDPATAPDTQVASWEFPSLTCTWEHRRYGGNPNENHYVGAYFYGTKGVFHMGWEDGWTFYPSFGEPVREEPSLNLPDKQNIKALWTDLLACADAGGDKRPVCDIEIGHRSTTLSLLGMLSAKLGRSVEWDGEAERCVVPGGGPDAEANKLLSREYRGEWEYPGEAA